MSKFIYQTILFFAFGFLSLQNSNAQCPSANSPVGNDTVCSGLDSATIHLTNVTAGAYYKTYLANQIIDSALAKGGSLALRISTKKLDVGKNKLTIKSTMNGCGIVSLLDSSIITINAAPKTDLRVIGDTICTNANFATVKIYGTTPGVAYQLSIGTNFIGATVVATTDTLDIIISRSALTLGQNKIDIRASVAGCVTSMLLNQVMVMVQAMPRAMFMAIGDTVCSKKTSAKLTIFPSDKSNLYTLYKNGNAFMNPFYGDSNSNMTVKQIPTSLLTVGNNEITVSTTFDMGACGTTNLSTKANIQVNIMPEVPRPIITGDTVFVTDKFATLKIKNLAENLGLTLKNNLRPDTILFGSSNPIELKIPIGLPNGLPVGTHKYTIKTIVQGCDYIEYIDSAFVVVKPDPTLSTENYFINSRFSVYPNPFSSELHFTNKLTGIVKLQIADALGNIVHQQTVSGNEKIQFNTDLKNGLYFLQIESDGKRELMKLIKQ